MLVVCCRQAVMLTEVAEGDMRLSVLMHQSCMANSLGSCLSVWACTGHPVGKKNDKWDPFKFSVFVELVRQKENAFVSQIFIYIYAFSRRFYPKRLTVHSGYTCFGQYMCSLGAAIYKTYFSLKWPNYLRNAVHIYFIIKHIKAVSHKQECCSKCQNIPIGSMMASVILLLTVN